MLQLSICLGGTFYFSHHNIVLMLRCGHKHHLVRVQEKLWFKILVFIANITEMVWQVEMSTVLLFKKKTSSFDAAKRDGNVSRCPKKYPVVWTEASWRLGCQSDTHCVWILHPLEEHLKANYDTKPLQSFVASHIPEKKKERERKWRHHVAWIVTFVGLGGRNRDVRVKHLVTQPGNAQKARLSH